MYVNGLAHNAIASAKSVLSGIIHCGDFDQSLLKGGL